MRLGDTTRGRETPLELPLGNAHTTPRDHHEETGKHHHGTPLGHDCGKLGGGPERVKQPPAFRKPDAKHLRNPLKSSSLLPVCFLQFSRPSGPPGEPPTCVLLMLMLCETAGTCVVVNTRRALCRAQSQIDGAQENAATIVAPSVIALAPVCIAMLGRRRRRRRTKRRRDLEQGAESRG